MMKLKIASLSTQDVMNNRKKIPSAHLFKNKGLTVVQLLNTHCHIDHVLGNQYIKTTYQTKLALHHLEEPILQATAIYAPQYGITNYELSQPDTLLKEGDQIKFGPVILDVLHVPGHSPGHIAFYDKKNKACFSGDVLFQGNIGRTDLPGGHRDTLLQTIRQKIFSLDDEVVIYPGHGAQTTVGEEQRNNPFCKCSA